MRAPKSLAFLATALTLAATGSAGAADKIVHIYNWSDYIAPDTLEKFEKATGIKPTYDVYDSNDTLEAKLLAGKSGYDLAFPTARPYAQRHIKAGIYAPLDHARLPNMKNMDPAIMASLQDMDPGNRYGIPYLWGTTGIGYNVKKIKEILGDAAPVDSWRMLFDPEITRKLAACGISFLDEAAEGIVAAQTFLGKDPAKTTEADVAEAAKAFQKVRRDVRYFHSSKFIADLANGDICVAQGYSGDVLQARNRAVEARNGVEIAYAVPKEGAVLWNDLMVIPKDAPNMDAAHAFIDFIMWPENIAAVSNTVAYANANAAATPLVDEAIRKDPSIYPPEAVKAKLFPLPTFEPKVQKAVTRAWTRIKTGR
jgi:putrescine transport system substrate-binding protein